MTEYHGSSIHRALSKVHGKQIGGRECAKIFKKYHKYRESMSYEAFCIKVYRLECDAVAQSNLAELSPPVTQSNLEPLPTDLNIIQADNDAQLISELDLTRVVNDVVPTVEPVANELNIIHTQSDSKPCDKFISINYRHADNSRHTVQLEQFYIDALIAIGITDISKFVAENTGVTTVTKNVKRSIVNALVNRVVG